MKHFSDETRRRMSESAKRRCNEEWLTKQRARGVQIPADEVKRMYEEGMTQEEIGKVFGVTQKKIYKVMKQNNITTRIPFNRNQLRENNTSWVGGVVKSERGYLLEKTPGHKRAKKRGDYVYQHILVAERYLEREIGMDEVVHHIDGCKTNNEPSNLSILSKSDHTKYHMDKKYNHPQRVFPIPLTEMR